MVRKRKGKWWSEVRQNVEAGSGEQFCIEPCHALVRTWVLLSEMRMDQKFSRGGVIWSNPCDDS